MLLELLFKSPFIVMIASDQIYVQEGEEESEKNGNKRPTNDFSSHNKNV